jgi:isoquinoline 1-oxidoreductase beta subunit
VLGWVRIAPDGAVTVLSNTTEIGQGTGTAIAQILADELDLDWRSVGLEMAPLEAQFSNPGFGQYATFGSGGVAHQFTALRKAGAQARAMLIAAAAEQWEVPAVECDTAAGAVVHGSGGRRLAYAELVLRAVAQPVPESPALMPRERWRYMGKDVARLDLPAKVDGSAVYGIDVKQKGMLTAVILQCPNFGGRLERVDAAPALKMRGVKHVVKLDNAVAVVADSFWHAKKGLDALKPRWDLALASKQHSDAYMAALREAAKGDGPLFVPSKSSADQVTTAYDAAQAKAVRSVEQIYSVPFLCHATMEPMTVTARVGRADAELWLGTQTQSATREAVAKELGLAEAAVTIHTTLAGGGFGRRIEYDFALQAVRIAKKTGALVKLIWSREEDMKHGFYRPAAAIRLKAGIGADGMPVALRIDSACESLLDYSRGGAFKEAAKPVDPTAIGQLPTYYGSMAVQVRVTTVDAGVPVGFWRAVAATQNVFAYESLIDELAHQAKIDPLVYRRRLLPEGSRERRTLDMVAERSGWSSALPPGRHRGLALSRANGSTMAQVIELSADADMRVKIHRITTVIDCGVAVNPRNVKGQVEGSNIFALSAAFYGAITLRDGAVEQSNFHDYRLIGLADTPPMDIVILEGGDKPGGVGEEAVGPLTPALTNALFAATGKRVLELPLTKAGFSLA